MVPSSSAAAATADDQQAGADQGEGQAAACSYCRGWTQWRGKGGEHRTVRKAVCSALQACYVAAYTAQVSDSTALTVIGAVFLAKLLVETWGQSTPTWVCPASMPLFLAVYVLGLPSVLYMYATCRVVDVEFAHREAVALALYLIGTVFSLSHEVHRFRWKARPENTGRLHTTGLARLCAHPNYFGDFFTYTGWGLAAGTMCATSLPPASLFVFVLFVCPNSDAYLASRYADEWPKYSASVASLIPGVRNRSLELALAWAGLALSLYMQASCGQACGL